MAWVDDTWDAVIGVVGPDGPARIKLTDGYAQWLFGAGRAYRAGAQLSRSGDDFDIVLRSTDLTSTELPMFASPSAGSGPLLPDAAMVNLLPVLKSSLTEGAPIASEFKKSKDDLDPEKLVITGIVDDGFNVFHQRFNPKGYDSRIEFAWIQDAKATSPSTVPFGMELTRDQITAESGDQHETALMREFGMVGPQASYQPRPLDHPATHGNHIADLAAGADPNEADARHNRLIMVQFPSLAVADTSGTSLSAAMQTAMIYILEKAFQMSRSYKIAIPVVVNISYALSGGARTGHHFLEQSFRKLTAEHRSRVKKMLVAMGVKEQSATPPVVRVLPAGNQHLQKLHARSGSTGSVKLPLRIQPEDRTASFLEVWVPRSVNEANVGVKQPNGRIDKFTVNQAGSAKLIMSTFDGLSPICRVTMDQPLVEISEEYDGLFHRILFAFPPSHLPTGIKNAAPAGLWSIDIDVAAKDATIEAWILRDWPVPGFPSAGRQSYFDDDSYEKSEFDHLGDIRVSDPDGCDAVVTRDGTISGIATNAQSVAEVDSADALDAVVVVAHRWDSRITCLYSSAGRDGAPYISAVAETSRVLPDIAAAGTLSGTTARLNGTSVAAPQVARWFVQKLTTMSVSEYQTFVPLSAVATDSDFHKRQLIDQFEIATASPNRVCRLAAEGRLLTVEPRIAPNIHRDTLQKV